MTETFQLEIVTPEKMVVKTTAEEMQIPGESGYLGVLPGHAPLITTLAAGEITYSNANITHRFAVDWGFAEVLPDRVTILAEHCESAADIDVSRAQHDKQHAEELLKTGQSEEDFTRAEAALRHAETQLEVAAKK